MGYVIKIFLFVFFTFMICSFPASSFANPSKLTNSKPITSPHIGLNNNIWHKTHFTLQVFNFPSTTSDKNTKPLDWVFLIALLGGVLATFTPYVYAILPITISYISIISKTKSHGTRNSIYYYLSLIIIFILLGVLITILIGTTGLDKLTKNWIFNLFFCRIFLGLGLSFLGAFEIHFPVRLTRKIESMSGLDNFKSIFFLALTLPITTISSTGPIAGLVMVFAGKGGFWGPIVGMAGFSIGFGLPFLFPVIINFISKSINWLNHVKVLLGFCSLLIGLKFLSNTDVALGWNLIDHDIFIMLWVLLSAMMGLYIIGQLPLSNDYVHVQNIYGQEYVPITRLFLAAAFFSFAIYLLPGIWGAPLYKIAGFLPK